MTGDNHVGTAPPWTADDALDALAHGVRPAGLTRDEVLALIHDGVPAPAVHDLEHHADGTTLTAYGRTFTAFTDRQGVRWWVATPDDTPDISIHVSSRVLLAHLTVAVAEGPGTWADVVVAPPVVTGPGPHP